MTIAGYAYATTLLKSDGTMWTREDVMPAIKDTLEMAAEDECPECARLEGRMVAHRTQRREATG